MYGGILNSEATSNASVPNRSTTKAATFRPPSTKDLTAARIDGRERVMVREMSVSILTAVGGDSSNTTAGRMRWSMAEGRVERREFWEAERGALVGMMKVVEKWWRWWSILANSRAGMRWPMPGEGRMMTWPEVESAMAGGGEMWYGDWVIIMERREKGF